MGSKKFILSASSAFLLALMPNIALVTTATAATEAGFCANVTNLKTKTDQKIVAIETKLQTDWSSRDAKISANRSKRDATLAADRAKWSSDRSNQFAKLEAKATTATASAAVKTFESQITSAISARETAVDSAISTYRAGVDKIISDRKNAIDSAISTFIASVDSAFSKASTDCANNVAPATVRQETVTSLKTARQTFQAARSSLTKFSDAFAPLDAARKAAVQTAIDNFKTTAQQARDELKLALGQ